MKPSHRHATALTISALTLAVLSACGGGGDSIEPEQARPQDPRTFTPPPRSRRWRAAPSRPTAGPAC